MARLALARFWLKCDYRVRALELHRGDDELDSRSRRSADVSDDAVDKDQRVALDLSSPIRAIPLDSAHFACIRSGVYCCLLPSKLDPLAAEGVFEDLAHLRSRHRLPTPHLVNILISGTWR